VRILKAAFLLIGILILLAFAPMNLVNFAQKTGLLVRKDCIHLQTRKERIECGFSQPAEQHQ
jgi:hypothetical protein